MTAFVKIVHIAKLFSFVLGVKLAPRLVFKIPRLRYNNNIKSKLGLTNNLMDNFSVADNLN